ncbi:P-loop containing nucleoside triphosphate hydrolase protein [Ustulina deusta]|nr:P-loop containing nucleoside triphosphate hydrolase protein [Ustulina deusta]
MIFIVCALHLLAAQLVPAQRSKGNVIRFRRPGYKNKSSSNQEEHRPTRFAQDEGKQDGSVQDNKASQQSPIPTIARQSSVKPGTLAVLMGVTGAGKTTLPDVLVNRASFGIARGAVCIDGQERDASFQRKIGYAQQDDIHLSTATVREALEFSALLRQPEVSAEEKLAHVDNVMQIQDMAHYADAIVGVPGDGRLNIEQRKRLTIGVELVAKPELLLFLDEPTSGLDSQAAWSVCTLLRKLADNGQAILCTIHQPSSQLFMVFDRLLLLNDKGECVYFGDIGKDGTTFTSYFEEHGAEPCDPGANPAEWMLKVTKTKNGHLVERKKAWSNTCQNSNPCLNRCLRTPSVRNNINHMCTPWLH